MENTESEGQSVAPDNQISTLETEEDLNSLDENDEILDDDDEEVIHVETSPDGRYTRVSFRRGPAWRGVASEPARLAYSNPLASSTI